MHLEGYYRDNLLDGRMFEYTPSGTTVAQREYRLGKKHGRHELWFKSGRPREIVTYLNDKPHGRMRTWYRSGFQRKDEHYENGVLEGVSVEYHDNGRIMRRVVFVNGKCEGENFLYSREGVLLNRHTCKNGKIDGRQFVYHTSAQRSRSSNSRPANKRAKSFCIMRAGNFWLDLFLRTTKRQSAFAIRSRGSLSPALNLVRLKWSL